MRHALLLVALLLVAGVGGAKAAASEDGGRIVFERGGAVDCNSEIWTASADGGEERLLIASPACVPRWSPDGTRLLYSRRSPSGSVAVYVADADGANERRVSSGRARDYAGDWSPDGTQIVFARTDAGQANWDLFVIPSVGGGRERQLTRACCFEGSPDWSPDGKRILFVSNMHGGDRTIDCGTCVALYLLPGWTRPLGRITRRSVQSGMPAWSPDGTQIAWARTPPPVSRSATSIWIMDSNSRNAHRLTNGKQPTWSPDGRTILFTRGSALWTIGVDGGGLRRMTEGHNPHWADTD